MPKDSDLVKDCPECDGKGYKKHYDPLKDVFTDQKVKCKRCNGTGVIIISRSE